MYLNRGLFERFAAVNTDRLDAESARLVEEYLKEFRQTGIQLDAAGQERLKAINAELSTLGTEFGQRVKEGMKSASLLLDDAAAELAGLPADDVASAAEAARAAGHEGKFLLTLIQPSNQPALAALENREVRRRLYEASIGRGSGGGALDVLDLVKDMVRLRAEKAGLLGFANFAELSVDQQTAPDFEAVQAMMNRLAPAAVRNADAEAEALAEVAGHPLEAWDWAYYSAQVKRERYSVDEQALRPYFELDRVLRDGVFFAATALYGITFHERTDLAGYHPDVRVWEVRNSDGTGPGPVPGRLLHPGFEARRGLDELPRGAIRTAEHPARGDQQPQHLQAAGRRTDAADPGRAADHLPRVRPRPARAVLLGHLPRFAGTSVPRDFVEYPSQVNEMWIMWPEVLANYARHHATGEPLPQEAVDKLNEAARSGARASAPPSTWAPRCWTSPGTSSTVPRSPRTCWSSRPRPWPPPASRTA